MKRTKKIKWFLCVGSITDSNSIPAEDFYTQNMKCGMGKKISRIETKTVSSSFSYNAHNKDLCPLGAPYRPRLGEKKKCLNFNDPHRNNFLWLTCLLETLLIFFSFIHPQKLVILFEEVGCKIKVYVRGLKKKILSRFSWNNKKKQFRSECKSHDNISRMSLSTNFFRSFLFLNHFLKPKSLILIKI